MLQSCAYRVLGIMTHAGRIVWKEAAVLSRSIKMFAALFVDGAFEFLLKWLRDDQGEKSNEEECLEVDLVDHRISSRRTTAKFSLWFAWYWAEDDPGRKIAKMWGIGEMEFVTIALHLYPIATSHSYENAHRQEIRQNLREMKESDFASSCNEKVGTVGISEGLQLEYSGEG
jgi:hypothetical protein